MEVRCFLKDYEGVGLYESPHKEVVIENNPISSRTVKIIMGDRVAEIIGHELIKAVNNCLNV